MARHNWSDDTSAPSVLFKKLETDIRLALRKINDPKLEARYRKALAAIRQNLVDIRIYTNAYDFSEERGEQLDNAKTAEKWLDQLRQHILKVSEANVFSAIDVAHLTAQIDRLIGSLE